MCGGLKSCRHLPVSETGSLVRNCAPHVNALFFLLGFVRELVAIHCVLQGIVEEK